MTTQDRDDSSLLEELSTGEDEFDVDLMACGCRLAPAGKLEFSIYDLVRMYALNEDDLVSMVGALIDEGRIPHDKVHELADRVARGEFTEKDKDERGKTIEDRRARRGEQ
ncbi:hypothetical protein [Catellatospora chokoriensis]|uniref:Uncharacterized protein n=1 Tax=Catellatospora chokoriensis TaxID=310353 RepID=A0A8J3JZX1_9ACTN|nr:hypothetical protein [Catellatospora chokoriensis]GIF94142.1 hypothetical protein Cch02nite_75860 [Catellatospora chokoriensis]